MASEADIFISYAHEDDRSPFSEEGWVTVFHRALEPYLAQLVGKRLKPSVWRDPRMPGDVGISDELARRVGDAAALVCVLTPSYLDSDWCRQERELFERARRAGDASATSTGLFKVVKIPVPLTDLPGAMQKVRGYDFYRVDRDSGVFLTLDPSIDPGVKADYWGKLNDLAQDISRLLQQRPGREPGESKPAVYVADTTFDLQHEYEEVRRDLLRHGYTVRPEERLPLVAGQLEAFVREQLAGCRLSVHLVGRKWGIVPEESRDSVVALQNAVAAQRSGEGRLERLIWLPPGLEPADEQQKGLVEALRRDNRNHLGADLLETSLEDLKTVIHQRLERPPDASRPDGATDLLRVYLVRDRRDGEQAAALEQRLLDQPGLEVIPAVFEGGEEEVRRDHEESLATSDVVLIYYGEGNELWLRRQQRDLVKSAGYGRLRKLLASGIYVAAPATPQKERLRSREAVVLRPDSEPAALDRFLRSIGDARAHHAG